MFRDSTLARQMGIGDRWGRIAAPRNQFLLFQRMPRPGTSASSCSPSPRQRLMEAFWRQTRRFLRSEASADGAQEIARSMLRVWGFQPQRLDELPLGLFVGAESMRTALLATGFTEPEINASKLLADGRTAGRLIGTVRDLRGQIVNFWAGSLVDREPKYLFLNGNWKQTVGVIGLETAMPAGSDGQIVLVEDPLDALLLQSKGLSRVAAIGSSGKSLTRRRWRRLAALGVRSVTLVPNDDQRGRQGLRAALRNALSTPDAPEVWFLPPGIVPGAATPAEMVRTAGTEAFRAIIASERVHSYLGRAMSILRSHGPDSQWTPMARRAALEEAIAFYVKANRGDSGRLDRHFVPTIVEGLGLDRDEPAAARIADPSSTGADYCEMHRCRATDCFCFD